MGYKIEPLCGKIRSYPLITAKNIRRVQDKKIQKNIYRLILVVLYMQLYILFIHEAKI